MFKIHSWEFTFNAKNRQKEGDTFTNPLYYLFSLESKLYFLLKFSTFDFFFVLDKLSIVMIFLTSLVTFSSLLININEKHNRTFSILFFLMEFVLIIAWLSTDLFLFFLCFETVLIPMFLIITIWGSRIRKNKAVLMFLLYTIIGSAGMLIAILWVFNTVGSTNLFVLQNYFFSDQESCYLCLAFIIAFAVKLPMAPFYSWLPEAHVEAPTSGSVFLAGVLLKLSTFGIIKFILPLFYKSLNIYFPYLIITAVLSIVYASLCAIKQNDSKRVIAYASIAHMNLIVIGTFAGTEEGISGSLFQMVNHGIVSSLLFLCVGILYKQTKTRIITLHKGLIINMPFFIFYFFIAIISNISFPGTNNFAGEFLLFLGIFNKSVLVGIYSTLAILLCVSYSLWFFNRIAYGNIANTAKFCNDIGEFESVQLFFLIYFILLFGLQPNVFLSFIDYEVPNITSSCY